MLQYDPEAGHLTWTHDSRVGPIQRGRRAEIKAGNYYRVWILGTTYAAHCLIWKIVHGQDPEVTVDHENRDGRDNRLDNLRAAEYSDQSCNRNKRPTWGIEPRGSKFRVRVQKNYHNQHIGVFDTYEEAEAAREEAVRTLHGEFASV